MLRSVDNGNLFSEAWKAAQAQRAAQEQAIVDGLPSSLREASGQPSDFSVQLDRAAQPVLEVDGAVRSVDELPQKLITGEVSDFHEIAGQLKRSELTFKFALEVRNKLIDAYREVMRMSV